MPDDNPVLAAIDARVEELGPRVETLRESIADLEAELEHLEQARAIVSKSPARHDAPAPADPPRRPKRGRSSQGSAKRKATPASGDSAERNSQKAAEREQRILAYVGGHPGLTVDEIYVGIPEEESLSGFRTFFSSRIRRQLRAEPHPNDGRAKVFFAKDAEGKAEAPPAPPGGISRQDSQTLPPLIEEIIAVDEGPPEERLSAEGNGDGTLDGRILSVLLMKRPTITELEVELRCQRKDLDKALSRLMRAGDVRTASEDGKRVLVGVP